VWILTWLDGVCSKLVETWRAVLADVGVIAWECAERLSDSTGGRASGAVIAPRLALVTFVFARGAGEAGRDAVLLLLVVARGAVLARGVVVGHATERGAARLAGAAGDVGGAVIAVGGLVLAGRSFELLW